MNDENLTASQWQAIAEKLAEYLNNACDIEESCYNCPLNCSTFILSQKDNIQRATKEIWIEQAKKELGYE